ncbi:hypothetical protein GOBAR_DD19325 [Gossypium barbadense]|nr:hypothetical protein GOBAR_DD19325 [Gossypium barbadense]
MEPQQQQQQNQQAPNEDCGGGSGKGSFLCRQSSTRWTPTTDQIRILKDLYYNNGVRSPSADQIQRISARLRQYGKIEGKNVFYGFRTTRLVRGRRKGSPPRLIIMSPCKALPLLQITSYSPTSLSSTGALTVGQIGNYGYGSITMEKSFRDCSISACGSSTSVGESLSHNFGWVGSEDGYTGSRASLELSLNPYAGRPQDSI